MTALTEFDYSLYKFNRYSSLGSFSIGNYDEIKLGSSSTSIVAVENDSIEQHQMQQSIVDEFEEILRSVSKTELEGLPRDAASEVDYYIYGTPKRKP